MDSAPLIKETLNRIMIDLYSQPQSPLMLLVDPKQYRMWEAADKFSGRDHRRLKREMNKAWRKERLAEIARPKPKMGIDRSANPWWRNHASTA